MTDLPAPRARRGGGPPQAGPDSQRPRLSDQLAHGLRESQREVLGRPLPFICPVNEGGKDGLPTVLAFGPGLVDEFGLTDMGKKRRHSGERRRLSVQNLPVEIIAKIPLIGRVLIAGVYFPAPGQNLSSMIP